MLSLHVVSLGCAKNQVDTERILGGLLPRTCALSVRPEDADVLLVNTCAFIRPARDEAREIITELCQAKRAGQRLIVCGCLVPRYQAEFAAELPGVDLWLPIAEEQRIPEHIERWFPGRLSEAAAVDRIRLSPRHYAYLRVADGCDHRCTFCTIPSIRGRYQSRLPADVLGEARALAADGVRELILIAQDTGSYGRDLGDDWDLARLARSLCRIDGVEWIRVMYLYPATVTNALLDAIAEEPKICPYIDLPLQHIDDTVLRAMQRPGSARTRDLLDRIRARVPALALRTTFIVGFPGETDAAFTALLDFVEEQQFHHVGTFVYYHEPGTAAYELGDTVPDTVKQDRRDRLMTAQQAISAARNHALVGSRCTVLVDEIDDAEARGRTVMNAPDVDNLVHLENAHEVAAGSFVEARVDRADPYDLYASVLPGSPR
jgi:ribosomal protein S12 methylthiotransferase